MPALSAFRPPSGSRTNDTTTVAVDIALEYLRCDWKPDAFRLPLNPSYE